MLKIAKVACAMTMLTLGVGWMTPVVETSAPQLDAPEKKGCCSHHKGVCGCENGRAKCCDGTFSPSCGC